MKLNADIRCVSRAEAQTDGIFVLRIVVHFAERVAS